MTIYGAVSEQLPYGQGKIRVRDYMSRLYINSNSPLTYHDGQYFDHELMRRDLQRNISKLVPGLRYHYVLSVNAHKNAHICTCFGSTPSEQLISVKESTSSKGWCKLARQMRRLLAVATYAHVDVQGDHCNNLLPQKTLTSFWPHPYDVILCKLAYARALASTPTLLFTACPVSEFFPGSVFTILLGVLLIPWYLVCHLTVRTCFVLPC